MKKPSHLHAALAVTLLASASALGLTFGGCISKSVPNEHDESTGKHLKDTVTATRVKSAVLAAPTRKSAEGNIQVFQGRVHPMGVVGSQGGIRRAVAVAREVKGLRSLLMSWLRAQHCAGRSITASVR